MVEPVETFDGWYSLHDLRSIDWVAWKFASESERAEALDDFNRLLKKWEQVELNSAGSHAFYKVIGQKADFIFMFLRPTVEELSDLETELNKSKMGDFLIPAYSYFSVIEMSRYRPEKPDEDLENSEYVQGRLYPTLPKWDYISFYPMNRRREGNDNWYTLEKNVRAKLLYEHSLTGRKYAGKIKQVITGSIGFDEWEWGVTLFAHDVLELKKIVYEMRFDEVSSRYGEFGDFFIGTIITKDEVNEYFKL